MLLEVATAGELLVAELAREGFLSGVDALVPDEVGYLGEGLLAAGVLAAVGLCLVVDAGVLLQGRVLGEGLVALRTN